MMGAFLDALASRTERSDREDARTAGSSKLAAAAAAIARNTGARRRALSQTLAVQDPRHGGRLQGVPEVVGRTCYRRRND